MNAARKSPTVGWPGFENRASRKARDHHYTLPANGRSRLPSPEAYYSRRVKKLSAPNLQGWSQGRCPFHEDHNASLSVHLTGERGGWRCFAGCGKGDLVSFHERLTGLEFKPAVRDLLGLAS